jgi:tripartite-type tricarboxylate transporter receptor subunit TctC
LLVSGYGSGFIVPQRSERYKAQNASSALTAREGTVMSMQRCWHCAAALAFITLVSIACANAEDWPTRPVKIVVAFGAGGTADELGRLLGSELSETFHQQFFVENRPGNSGSIGSALVARSAADGYTLLIGGAGPLLVAPAVNPNITYDTIKDFSHIAVIVADTFMLAVTRNSGAKSLGDLIKIGKDSPVACGSVGTGSQGDLLQHLITQQVGLNLTIVPYKSAAEITTDMLGGHLPCALQTAIGFGEWIKSGNIIPIAIAGAERLPAFADVPTFAELGFPNVIGVAWFWLAGPRDMPPDIVDRLNREVRRIVQLPKTREFFAADSLLTKDADVGATEALIVDEVAKWGKVAKQVGYTTQ